MNKIFNLKRKIQRGGVIGQDQILNRKKLILKYKLRKNWQKFKK